MNDRHRKLIVVILANAGAAIFATALIRSGWIQNIPSMVLLSFLAGTLGYLIFTWFGTQLMRLQKRRAFGQLGKAVYAFGKLPPGEAVSAGGKGRVLAKNRTVAEDLKKAHEILLRIAHCLRYPPSAQAWQFDEHITSQSVAQEMTKLIEEVIPCGRVQRAQVRLLGALKRRWELFGQELLYCYDIPGLPQDNLHLESLFGRLRRHQRRISGQKSTREINAFGQAQVLFKAKTPQDLLNQIQLVPHATYLVHRNRLADAELPRQFFHRLRRNPFATVSTLIQRHAIHSQGLKKHTGLVLIEEQVFHTQ